MKKIKNIRHGKKFSEKRENLFSEIYSGSGKKWENTGKTTCKEEIWAPVL